MHTIELIKKHVPTIEVLRCVDNAVTACQHAFQVAKKHSKRAKLLVLADVSKQNPYAWLKEDINLEIISAGDTALLCDAIANTSERIAAIVVNCLHASPYYYQKVRELASAEGALMIWDETSRRLDEININKLSKNSRPDIICFSLIENTTSTWIGGKRRLLESIDGYR